VGERGSPATKAGRALLGKDVSSLR
jgi:diacylglycerol kinase (ATP)